MELSAVAVSSAKRAMEQLKQLDTRRPSEEALKQLKEVDVRCIPPELDEAWGWNNRRKFLMKSLAYNLKKVAELRANWDDQVCLPSELQGLWWMDDAEELLKE